MTRQLDSTGLKRLHRTWRRRSVGQVGLLLDNVQSPFDRSPTNGIRLAHYAGGMPPDAAKPVELLVREESLLDEKAPQRAPGDGCRFHRGYIGWDGLGVKGSCRTSLLIEIRSSG